ncbi:transcription factor SRM1-like [Bidens hawaiensis]|uniref:transcription factor SRM1-like n=1 Tax=Bidens hawaiensis TaxID=980011 RepID=UPI00404A45ED
MQNEENNSSMFVNAVAPGLEEMVDMILDKTTDEVKAYHEALVRELHEIEAGQVELLDYPCGSSYLIKAKEEKARKKKKKANSWTIDEHKRFLNGLKTYGKGDWRSISRKAVVTRTTQVASHAQKFFLRHKEGNNNNKTKKRYSIHDITTADA